MTDKEFEQKVSELRDAFKKSMTEHVGGQEKFLSANDDDFADIFSVCTYASLSVMATLSSVLMTRYALISGMTSAEAIEVTNIVFHEFLPDLLNKGQESFLENLQRYKNLKNSN